jgi:hypothetical protein
MLLKEVRIFTHPNGDVMLQCVGREDVIVPPLRPGAKPGVGDVPRGLPRHSFTGGSAGVVDNGFQCLGVAGSSSSPSKRVPARNPLLAIRAGCERLGRYPAHYCSGRKAVAPGASSPSQQNSEGQMIGSSLPQLPTTG